MGCTGSTARITPHQSARDMAPPSSPPSSPRVPPLLPVHIFWDIENVGLESSDHLIEFIAQVQTVLTSTLPGILHTPVTPMLRWTTATNARKLSAAWRKGLSRAGVLNLDSGTGKAEASDRALEQVIRYLGQDAKQLRDISHVSALGSAARPVVVLITTDNDFAAPMRDIKPSAAATLLITPPDLVEEHFAALIASVTAHVYVASARCGVNVYDDRAAGRSSQPGSSAATAPDKSHAAPPATPGSTVSPDTDATLPPQASTPGQSRNARRRRARSRARSRPRPSAAGHSSNGEGGSGS